MEKTVLEMNPDFLVEVEEKSGVKVSACYQCRKCTNGCPVTFAMDLYPDQVMRYIQLGLRKEILQSSTIWVCASCETCTTRCPNEVDIAKVMDYLKQTIVRKKDQSRRKKSIDLPSGLPRLCPEKGPGIRNRSHAKLSA